MSVKKKSISVNFSDLCANRKPVIAAGTASQGKATELADLAAGENAITHTQTGKIKFLDPNSADTHSASVVPLTSGNQGSFVLGPVNQAANSVSWKFSVPDASINRLAAGQTIIQKYKVTISDGHGGQASQIVTMRIVGSNDAPLIQAFGSNSEEGLSLLPPPPAGDVTEDFQVSPAGTLTDSGTFTFDDDDLIDSHTVSVMRVSSTLAGGTGSMSVTIADAATGAGNGTIKWNYNVDNSLVQYLDDGEVAVETYLVKVNDGHGGTDTQLVTVTIHGRNDPPVAVNDNNSTSEDVTLSVPALAGVLINDTDPDGEPLHVTEFTVDTVAGVFPAGGTAPIPGVGSLTINADGSYTFDPDPGYTGPVPVATYTVSDGTETDTGTLTLNVTPVDNPVSINGIGLEGGDEVLDEDDLPAGSSPNPGALTQSGSFTISIPDGFGSLTIGGTPVVTGSTVAAFPLAIATPLGTLIITGINFGTGIVSYDYELSSNTLTHGLGDNGENSVFDNIPVVLTDTDGDMASATLKVRIVDDVPDAVARDDAGSIHVHLIEPHCASDDDDDNDDDHEDDEDHSSDDHLYRSSSSSDDESDDHSDDHSEDECCSEGVTTVTLPGSGIAALFEAPVKYGADGPGSVAYGLTAANGAATGLWLAGQSGAANEILLVKVSDTLVEGRAGGPGGTLAFSVSINAVSGAVTISQAANLHHDGAGGDCSCDDSSSSSSDYSSSETSSSSDDQSQSYGGGDDQYEHDHEHDEDHDHDHDDDGDDDCSVTCDVVTLAADIFVTQTVTDSDGDQDVAVSAVSIGVSFHGVSDVDDDHGHDDDDNEEHEDDYSSQYFDGLSNLSELVGAVTDNTSDYGQEETEVPADPVCDVLVELALEMPPEQPLTCAIETSIPYWQEQQPYML